MYEDICSHLGRCLNPLHSHGELPRLSRLVDLTDPAFDYIAEVLADMAGANVQLTPEVVNAAVKVGRLRFQREELPRLIAPAVKREVLAGPVVYYIRRGNLIKIGTTARLKRRMNALMPDEILALEPGGKGMELERHAQFQQLRTTPRGEYFFPGAALQGHISRVRAQHGAPPGDLPSLQGASRAWTTDLPVSVEESELILLK